MGSSMSSSTGASSRASSDAARLVNDTIAAYPVVVFSKTYCPYCHKAKRALEKAARHVDGFREPHILELDQRADGSAIQAAIARKTGRRTVPSVFVGGKPIGGGDETAALQSAGKLASLISAAVAK